MSPSNDGGLEPESEATTTTTAEYVVEAHSSGRNGRPAVDPWKQRFAEWGLIPHPSHRRYEYDPQKPIPPLDYDPTSFQHDVDLNGAAQRADLDWTEDPVENTRLVREWLAEPYVDYWDKRMIRFGFKDPPRLDPWKQRLIDHGLMDPPPARTAVNGSTCPTGNRQAWAKAVLNGEAGKVATAAEGTRNDTLNTAALRCYRIVPTGLLDEDTVTDALTEAARRAGLPDTEIHSTLGSAWNGAQKYGPADDVPEEREPDVVELRPGTLGGTTDSDGEGDGDGDQGRRPWQSVDLGPVLSGDWTPPKPSVGRRSDDVGLIYPGKLHTISSESEAGKTWLALVVASHELLQGNSVLYIDFEDDEGGVVGRLLTLQVGPEVIARHFHYVRPTEALGGGINLIDLGELVTTHHPVLVVIDGITEAMTMHGLDPLSNKDIADFGRILPRRLANAGPAVVCLDHVVKATDSRGRYSIGGVHKLNGLDGAAYILENREPFGIGLTGRSTILIAKDRPGQLRKHAQRRKDGLDDFGDLILTSHDASYIEYEIRPVTGPAKEFMPTILMAKISDALAEHGAMTQRQILVTVKGKRQYAIDALTLLQRDGYVSAKSPHERLKPYPDAGES